MKPALLVIILGVLYILHQDFWFWRTADPLMFGFIPIGLSYHAGYTLLTSLVLWVLVRRAWPAHLEAPAGDPAHGSDAAPKEDLERKAREDQAR